MMACNKWQWTKARPASDTRAQGDPIAAYGLLLGDGGAKTSNHDDEDDKRNAQETANDRSKNKTRTKNKTKTNNNQLVGHATGVRGQQTSISWLETVKKRRGYKPQRHRDRHTRKGDATKTTM